MFDYEETETTVLFHAAEANTTNIIVVMFAIYSNRAVTLGIYIYIYILVY